VSRRTCVLALPRAPLLALLLVLAGCAGAAEDGGSFDGDASARDAMTADAAGPDSDAAARDQVSDHVSDAARPRDDGSDLPPDAADARDGGSDLPPDAADSRDGGSELPSDAGEPRDGGPDLPEDAGGPPAGGADLPEDAGGPPDGGADLPEDAGEPRDGSPDAAPDAQPDVAPDAPQDAAMTDDVGDGPLPDDAGSGSDAGLLVSACPEGYAAPVETGVLDTAELHEASGIAHSGSNPGVLWMHNDAGDRARLFAVREDGRLLAILTLTGVTARDFEDLSAAPCPDGSGPCLWVGDIGNNNRTRTSLTIYVVREPLLPAAGDAVAALEAPPDWTFPGTFPGDPFDAEGLAVAPDGSNFYVFEKADREAPSVLTHPGPLESGVSVPLVPLTTVAIPQWTGGGRLITGADIHPTGRRLLLRTYAGSVEYRFADGQGMADLAAVTGTIVARGPSSEGQGEAACWDASGAGFWTVSEKAGGFQPLHYYPCQ
jgi:hypothetical protein